MSVSEGENLILRGFGWCHIVSTADPSLVTVRLPSGACIRIGQRALEQLRDEAERERGVEAL